MYFEVISIFKILGDFEAPILTLTRLPTFFTPPFYHLNFFVLFRVFFNFLVSPRVLQLGMQLHVSLELLQCKY